MKDYSQNGEQLQILRYFEGQLGTVLSIGENDGITLSNSRALVELGWGAVLVEPSETAFRKLRALYDPHADLPLPQGMSPANGNVAINRDGQLLTLIQAAITTQDGPVDFWDCGVHLHKNDTSLLSTTHPETMSRWKRSGEQFTKTTVRGMTFDTLLKETGMNHFDFISIDAEGADLDILRQMDLTAIGCLMLCVETNWNDAPFVEYAASHGMHLLRKCVENAIFVR